MGWGGGTRLAGVVGTSRGWGGTVVSGKEGGGRRGRRGTSTEEGAVANGGDRISNQSKACIHSVVKILSWFGSVRCDYFIALTERNGSDGIYAPRALPCQRMIFYFLNSLGGDGLSPPTNFSFLRPPSYISPNTGLHVPLQSGADVSCALAPRHGGRVVTPSFTPAASGPFLRSLAGTKFVSSTRGWSTGDVGRGYVIGPAGGWYCGCG